MRSLMTVLLCSAIVCPSTWAANNPIAGLEPVLYSESGWLWGTFNEDVSTIEFTNDSIVFDIQPAGDDGEYPGRVNGGMGTNYGSDRFGSLDMDHELYQIEVPLRILDDNVASQFRIAVGDTDGTDGVRDEFYYYVNTFDYEIGEWDTFVRPLTEYSELWSNGGDGVMNLGTGTVQLMTMWDTADALNVEIGGIFITEINPTPSRTIFELNANNFGQAWTWGAYDADGAVTYGEDSITINTQGQGGLGHGLMQTEFDGETSELVVAARLLEDNEAASFLIEIRDNEQLNGIFSDGFEDLEWEAEQYTYEIFTDEFTDGEFTEFRIPMTDFTTRQQAGGDVNADGDFELNFGMYMMHIMSPAGGGEMLNVEIQSIRIEPIGGGVVGDYDGSGVLDAADLDLQAQVITSGVYDAEYDLNDDQQIDTTDRRIWVEDLKNTWLGDADLDGEFTSGDLVIVVASGKYEVDVDSTWEEGDFNADLRTTTSDLVAALAGGGYEQGPRPAVNAVPEPASIALLLVGLIATGVVTRGRELS